MLELTAAQSLIALPPVGCITGIGIASAVFTYYLVKLLVKPFIDVRLADNPTLNSPQTSPRPSSLSSISIALQIIAGVFLPTAAPILEALLTAIIAAAVATFGHESIRNFGKDKA